MDLVIITFYYNFHFTKGSVSKTLLLIKISDYKIDFSKDRGELIVTKAFSFSSPYLLSALGNQTRIKEIELLIKKDQTYTFQFCQLTRLKQTGNDKDIFPLEKLFFTFEKIKLDMQKDGGASTTGECAIKKKR